MAISALIDAFAKEANIANLALLLALIAVLWENVLASASGAPGSRPRRRQSPLRRLRRGAASVQCAMRGSHRAIRGRSQVKRFSSVRGGRAGVPADRVPAGPVRPPAMERAQTAIGAFMRNLGRLERAASLPARAGFGRPSDRPGK